MNKINFTPFPVLKTERLTLRCLDLSDDQLLFKLRSDKIVNKYIVRPKQKDIKEIRAFISKINEEINNNEWIYWVISLKDDPTLIGDICFWNFSEDKTVAEIGYELDPTFQGKGIMSEALKKIIDFGFDKIKLNTIEAYTHKNNSDSTKLLHKYSFKLEEGRIDKENIDNIIFTLAKKDWMELQH